MSMEKQVGQMDKWGQMGDKWESHLSRQFGRTNGVWVYRHTPYVLLSQSIWDVFCKKSVRIDLWQQGT
jgi:hypothetical protein